jgi:hypothetical protein
MNLQQIEQIQEAIQRLLNDKQTIQDELSFIENHKIELLNKIDEIDLTVLSLKEGIE